jgi:hypothetical protein
MGLFLWGAPFADRLEFHATVRAMTYAEHIARLLKLLRDPWPPRVEAPPRAPEGPARIVEPPRQHEPPR